MILRCTCNDIRRVNSNAELNQELKACFGTDTHLLELTVGGLYVVYGVEINTGWVRYYVADDVYTHTLYPIANLAAFFEVVDPRVSRCWTVGCRNAVARSSEVLITFREWANDAEFYERLIDGGDLERSIFADRKEFMDLEYPNPSIVDAAEAISERFLLCPRCSETWDSEAVGGLVRCPQCQSLLSNPQFAGEKVDTENLGHTRTGCRGPKPG